MCCNYDLSKYFNINCIGFVVSVVFSILAFIISVITLFKLIDFPGSDCWATGVLSGILGVWTPTPRLKPTRTDDNTNNV